MHQQTARVLKTTSVASFSFLTLGLVIIYGFCLYYSLKAYDTRGEDTRDGIRTRMKGCTEWGKDSGYTGWRIFHPLK